MHYARLKCAAAALLVIQAAPLATLADDAPSDRSNSRPLDEIVVVAHKEERSIRDVAANVTVLSQQDLVEAIATSVSDVFRFVPGVDDEGAGWDVVDILHRCRDRRGDAFCCAVVVSP